LTDNGLGGMSWECVAITLDDLQQFLMTIQKSRDENEKILREQLEEHLLPILEKQEEAQKRKAIQRERELLNLAKMANAKRSSRIAHKAEQHKLEEKVREEEKKRQAEDAAARRAEQERLKLEKERDLRMLSREIRLKERDARRTRHTEELAHLSERDVENKSDRVSQRQLHAEIEKQKQALKTLSEEDGEEDWLFDCVCGVYGQIDDGTHSIACEKCSVWQHSKCVGISESEAEQPEFHFMCDSCRCREAEKSKPRPTIKLRINHQGPATSSNDGIGYALGPNTEEYPKPLPLPTSHHTNENDTMGNRGVAAPVSKTSLLQHSAAGAQSLVSVSNAQQITSTESFQCPLVSTKPNCKQPLGLHQLVPNSIALERTPQHVLPPTGLSPAKPLQCMDNSITNPEHHQLSTPRSITAATPIELGSLSRSFHREMMTPGGLEGLTTQMSKDQTSLPPSQGGLSPVKLSPSMGRQSPKLKTTALILPPIMSLAPSPQQSTFISPAKTSEESKTASKLDGAESSHSNRCSRT
jgi:hypothetical protein